MIYHAPYMILVVANPLKRANIPGSMHYETLCLGALRVIQQFQDPWKLAAFQLLLSVAFANLAFTT